MKHVFWLIPGEVAGRAGPNAEPWDPAALSQGGIGAILSVNDGEMVDRSRLQRAGIRYECVSLSSGAPPEPGDLEICIEALPRGYAFARESIDDRRAVMVHCAAGKDRTGLFMSYYLYKSAGLSAEAAIAEVRRVRPVALTAEGWDAFAVRVLRGCGAEL